MRQHTATQRRRRTTGALAAIAAASLLAACSGGTTPAGSSSAPASSEPAAVTTLQPPSEPVSLDIWVGFTGPDGETFKSIVDAIVADTPNLDVNLVFQSDYETTVRTAATTGTLPHGGITTDPVNWAVDDIVAPMDDYASLVGLDPSEYPADVWDHSVLRDHRYGVPFDIQPIAFFWNKALFRQAGLDPETPPANAQEWTDDAKAITTKAGVPGFMVVSGGPGAVFLTGFAWTSLAYQGGMEWANADYSKATFNSQAGVDAADFLKNMITDGVSPADVQSDAELAAFTQGQNGMLISGVWQTARLKEALGDDLGGAFLPPVFGDGAWASSQQLVTFNRPMTDAERGALYYFFNQLTLRSIDWAKSGSIPARASVRESADFQAIPITSDIAKGIGAVQLFPKAPGAADMLFGTGAAGEALIDYINGGTPIQEGLDAAADRYTKIIQEAKDKYDLP